MGTFLCAHNARAQTTASSIPASASYSCDFEDAYCDFNEQSKIEPGRRSSFVASTASSARGVKLTTLPGDNSVHGSGTWERNDLSKGPDGSYCNAGQEEWWAFSIMFPDDYVFPPGPEAGILMDFHHNASSGQANYEIQTMPGIGLRARGYGGASINSGKYDALIPDPYGAVNNVTHNAWYHFVLHVRWSPNGDGLMEGWVNGKRYQSYQGPTQYSGIPCYFKLANYHAPFGQASSVVYDRVVRGSSAQAVTMLALEGVAGTGTFTPTPPATPAVPTSYALSTITMGSGTGTVTSSPSGINCGSSCSSSFAPGAAVTMNASASAGSTFAGWSGACSGSGACTVSMSSAKSVTATFNSSSSTAPTNAMGVSVSASQLGWGGVAGTRTVTYTNNTGATITFIKASISSGKFQQTNNCGDIAAGKSCTATVTYYPSNSGTTTATFTMTSTAPNSPHVVTLSATGSTITTTQPSTPSASAAPAAGVTPSASSLAFDSANRTRTVTFTNNTSAKVTFIQASISSGKFQQTNNCGDVAPGASCTATVTYYPTNGGSDTATFTMSSTAANSPARVTLSSTPGKRLVTI